MHADIYALTVIDDYRNVKLYSTMSWNGFCSLLTVSGLSDKLAISIGTRPYTASNTDKSNSNLQHKMFGTENGTHRTGQAGRYKSSVIVLETLLPQTF